MEPIYTRATTLLVAALFAGGELNHPAGTQGVIMIDKLGTQIRFFGPVSFAEIAAIGGERTPTILCFPPTTNLNPNPGHEIDIAPHRAPHGIQIDAAGLL